MLDLGKLGRWWSGGAALLLLVAMGLGSGALVVLLLLSAAAILLGDGGGSVLWLMLYSSPLWAPLSVGYLFAALPRPLVRDVMKAGTIS